eukprot:UN21654
MAKLAVETKCVGFDIAGDEQKYPLKLHKESLEYCKKHQLPLTVHAGEWENSLDNLEYAIDLGVQRIGQP